MNLMDNVQKHIPCLATKLMEPLVHSSSNRLASSYRPTESLVEEENYYSHNYAFNDSWKEREHRPYSGDNSQGHKSKIKNWHSRERCTPYTNKSSYSKERYSQYHPRPVKPQRPSFDSQHSNKNRDYNSDRNEWPDYRTPPMRQKGTSRGSSGSASSSRSNPIAKLLPNVSECSKKFATGANYLESHSQDGADFSSVPKGAISNPVSNWDNKGMGHGSAAYRDDEISPMDVDIINEEDLLMDIREVREQLRNDPPTVWNEIASLSNADRLQNIKSQEKKICVVLDTNVFLVDFTFLETLQQTLKDMGCHFILLVPWMVFQELDLLKTKNSKLKNSMYRRAQACLGYLYKQLNNSTSHFHGQSMTEASSFNSALTDNNDDHILHCCNQYSKKGNYAVILYSNDKNLCNKAIVSNISAYPRKNIVDGIFLTVNKLGWVKDCSAEQSNFPSSNVSYNANTMGKIAAIKSEMEEILKQQLSKIVETEMMKVYDSLWMKVIAIKPPWNLADVFHCLKKHWVAVFGFLLRKCDLDTLETLVASKKGNSDFTDIYKLNDFIDTAISLLIGFQKHSNYCGTVSESLEKLYSYRATCHKLTNETTQVFPANNLNVNYLDPALVPNSNVQMLQHRPYSATYSEYNPLTSSSVIEREHTVDVNKEKYMPKRSYSNDFKAQSNLNKKKSWKDPSSPPYRIANRKKEFPSHEKNSYYQPPESQAIPDLAGRPCKSSRPEERTAIPLAEESQHLLVPEIPKIELAQTKKQLKPLPNYQRSAVEPLPNYQRSTVEPLPNYQRSTVEPLLSPQRSTAEASPDHRNVDVLKVFECVWECINQFCGLLCDTFKIPHKIHYSRPLELPRLDEAQSFLPRIYPQINRMCKELRSIVNADWNHSDYKEACTLLYNSLVTFFPNLDIKDDEGLEGMLTPEMIIEFCANDNKSLLKRGLIQINDYREYLFQCLRVTRRSGHM